MKFINGLYNLPSSLKNCVATIGNFDGVHRGHQQILNNITTVAESKKLPSLVIIFEPHPREFFNPHNAPARLTRLREKLILLKNFNIDYVLCLPFKSQLANMSAEDFFNIILVEKLGVRYLMVGDDFRFGHKRHGDFELLKACGKTKNMQIEAASTFLVDNLRVSSTIIRQALADGDIIKAKHLLGRDYSMCGRIIHGNKLGRELGYPTANINLHRQHSPLHGIYTVHMEFSNLMLIDGVASIGTRPTVDGAKMILEVYLLDFASDIYGEHVQVNFLHKLRDELKFNSLDELKLNIERDEKNARAFFK